MFAPPLPGRVLPADGGASQEIVALAFPGSAVTFIGARGAVGVDPASEGNSNTMDHRTATAELNRNSFCIQIPLPVNSQCNSTSYSV